MRLRPRQRHLKSVSPVEKVENQLDSTFVVYGFYAINCGINDHAFTLDEIVNVLVNRSRSEHVGSSDATHLPDSM